MYGIEAAPTVTRAHMIARVVSQVCINGWFTNDKRMRRAWIAGRNVADHDLSAL